MDILFTGKLECVSKEIAKKMKQRHNPVFASSDCDEKAFKGYKCMTISPHNEQFEKIFNSYNFETAVFFSQQPGDTDEYTDEFRDLDFFLRYCADHDVHKVVFVSSTAVFAGVENRGKKEVKIPLDYVGMKISSCEGLCEFYRVRKAMSILILRVPFLYSPYENGSFVGKMVTESLSKASLTVEGAEEQECDYLSHKDFGELLVRILEDWRDENKFINVCGANTLSFKQLAAIFKEQIPVLRVSYAQSYMPVSKPIKSEKAREDYDWVAINKLSEDIPYIINKTKKRTKKENNSLKTRLSEFFAQHVFVLRALELFFGFLVLEFLNYATDTMIQFQYVDFRLMFVMLFSIAYGLKTGFASGLLACVSMLIAYARSKNGMLLIVYNVDNWLPFVCYIVIAGAIGYTKDKLKNDNKSLSDEKEILKSRYNLLNEFYESALANKGQFKNQIVSYKDSFGRFFEITKKLDCKVPEDVFSKAIQALEEVLDNQSIAIYSIEPDSRFARLVVSSKSLGDVIEKSLMMERFPEITDNFMPDEVWSNKMRLLGYPDYAFPIFDGNRLIAMVVLYKVRSEQFAAYYENLVRVLCGLIKISLIRALEYYQKSTVDMYVEGTNVMNAEHFKKVIAVKEEMKNIGIAEYVLIAFDTDDDTLIPVSEAVSRKIRRNDIMGIGEDGRLYLCLTQTSMDNISIVLKRITELGLVYDPLDSDEEDYSEISDIYSADTAFGEE